MYRVIEYFRGAAQDVVEFVDYDLARKFADKLEEEPGVECEIEETE